MAACFLLALMAAATLAHVAQAQNGTKFTVDDCPMTVNRDKYLQIHNVYCYEFVVYRKLDYEDSSNYCRSRGGSLVKVDTLADQMFIHGQLFATYKVSDAVWIGLTDHNSDDVWEWERDGSVPTYSNWAPGQPGVGHGLGFEDCAAMEPTDAGQWHDYRCNDLLFISFGHPFVCQYGPINGVVVDELTDAPTMRPTRQTSPMMDAFNTTVDSGMSNNVTMTTMDSGMMGNMTTMDAGMMGNMTTMDAGIMGNNATMATVEPTDAPGNSSYAPGTTMADIILSNATTAAAAGNATFDRADVCPPFTCGLDCGLDGYQTSPQGCQLCVCDV